MANDKREDVNAEKIYGHLCRTSKEEFISEFNVKEGGLTDEEVEQRIHRFGHNEVTQSKPKRWYHYLLKSLLTPFNSILIGIALVYGRFSAYAILSNARAWFYLFLGYCVFKKDNAVTTGDLLCLSFGMIIGWALMSVYNIFFVYTALTTTEYYERAVEASGVMIGIPMFFALAFSHKNKLLLLSGIALFIFICMFSGLRRIIIGGLVSIFATITVTALNNKKKIFCYVLGGFVVVMILMAILPLAENYIKELSPMLHHRIFYRTQNFFAGTGGDEGDMTRVNNMIIFADEFIVRYRKREASKEEEGIRNDTLV